jgi:TorA maturation chaperone TorD
MLDDNACRSDLYLTLSRAFAVPLAPASFEAFRCALAEDLGEYGHLLGYPIADAVGFLGRSIESVESADQLLQIYSGLFLQPPRRAHLNASLHLDGALLGRSADACERAYAQYGLVRAESFRELPDHLTLQLEFLAFLYQRASSEPAGAAALVAEAQAFNRALVLSWVPMLARQLRQAVMTDALHPLYVNLAGVLQEVLTADAGEIPDELWGVIDPERAAAGKAQKREMIHCRECGVAIAPAGRVRRVRKVLEREGIDGSHLDLCFDCRGAPQVLMAQLTTAASH